MKLINLLPQSYWDFTLPFSDNNLLSDRATSQKKTTMQFVSFLCTLVWCGLVMANLWAKASLQPFLGLLLCSCLLPPLCYAVCLSAAFPVRLSVPVCSWPRFICIAPTHPYSWWKRVIPRGYVSVSAIHVYVQDLIGPWSEGILCSESQVEREQRPHCFEHYAFSIVSPFPSSSAHRRSCGGSTRCLFIRLNLVWSGTNSVHI